jgi:hypothetical protein
MGLGHLALEEKPQYSMEEIGYSCKEGKDFFEGLEGKGMEDLMPSSKG